jgi:arsenate reductase (thioredoxin)
MNKLVLWLLILPGFSVGADAMELLPELSEYVQQRTTEFDQITQERKIELVRLAEFVSGRQADGNDIRLTFICTHNSRRSHFAQLWAQVAAIHYGLGNVETYSGGTEETAFNPRAVAALRRTGMLVELDGPASSNPVYQVRLTTGGSPIECFSKRYDQPPNPSKGFAAVMTCSEADDSCPSVSGSDARLAIAYDDPKQADGSSAEARTYDERCRQIAREMLYAFSLVGL